MSQNQSENLNELFKALSNVQKVLQGAKKDAANPYFKSKYADLESVWEAIRNPLTANGLSVVQMGGVENGEPGIYTTLGHASGQWMRGFLPLTMAKKDPQAQGSAITYARRYALAAAIGVVQTDDDGEEAMNRARLPGGRVAPRIYPEQPEPGDAGPDHRYRIPFGKFRMRTLEEVGVDQLKSYIAFLEAAAEKKKEEIKGEAKEFIDIASDFIAAFEMSPIEKG